MIDYINQEKTNPFAILPYELSDNPQTAFEQCLKCFMDSSDFKIDYSKTNSKGHIKTEALRINASQKYLKTKEWAHMMQEWEEVMLFMETKEPENVQSLREKMNTVISDPSVENVAQLQRCIDMPNEDDPNGQDGILGPNTTRAILEFIRDCQARYKAKEEKEQLQSVYHSNSDIMPTMNSDVPQVHLDLDVPVIVATELASMPEENFEDFHGSQDSEFYNVAETLEVTDRTDLEVESEK